MAPNPQPLWATIVFPKLISLWNNEHSCDVTIICIDGCIKAPSILLCALSEKLYEILEISTDKVLQFKNIKIKTWKDLLHMLYSGQPMVNTDGENELLSLYSVLLFAYYLGMDCVLKLFKHCAFLDKDNLYSDLWELSCPEFGMNIQVEYSHIESGNMTNYETTFSSNDLSGLGAYLQKPDEALNDKKVIQILKRNQVKNIILKCLICDDGCKADFVRCFYCDDVVSRKHGLNHLSTKHSLIPSSTWPFTCNVENTEGISPLIGEIVLKRINTQTSLKGCDKSKLIWYRCLLCKSYHDELNGFLNHYFCHGLFPCVCRCCSSVFSAEEFLIEHLKYCSMPVSLNRSAEILEDQTFSLFSDKAIQVTDTFIQTCITADKENEIVTPVQDEFSDHDLDSPGESQAVMDEANLVKREIMETQCLKCRYSCVSESAQCLFCYNVVRSHSLHMEKEHPHSLQARCLFVTCNVIHEFENAMVLRKSVIQGKTGFECMLCYYITDEKEHLVSHLNDKHNVAAAFCCKFCESGFKFAIARNGHQHLCGGGSCIQCKKCNERFPSYDQLQRHMKNSHKIKIENISPTRSKRNMIKDELEEEFDTAQHTDISMIQQIGQSKIGSEKVVLLPLEKMHVQFEPKKRPRGRPKKQKNVDTISSSVQHKGRVVTNTKDKYPSRTRSGRLRKPKSFYDDSDDEGDEESEIDGPSELPRKNLRKWSVKIREMDESCSDEDYVPTTPIQQKGGNKYQARPCSKENQKPEKVDKPEIIINPVLLKELTNYTGPQKSVCFACKKDTCTADVVKCAYCYKVVKNDGTHMQDFHPFTPRGCLWAFTCRFIAKTAINPHEWVVTAKRLHKDSVPHHTCLKCNLATVIFARKDTLINHMKTKHNITPFFCQICEMGFSDRKYKKDHQHFCSGGKPLICEICNVDIGSSKLLKDHMRTRHGNKTLMNKNEGDCSDDDKNNTENHQNKISTEIKKEKEVDDELIPNEEHPSEEEIDPNVADVINSNFGEMFNEDVVEREFDDEHSHVQPEDIQAGQRYHCVNCNKECTASKVKCLYCYKIVNNDLSHMDTKHPFTPRTSAWMFTCRFLAKSERMGLKEWVVSVKEPVLKVTDGNKVNTGQVQYRCLKCKKYVFQSISALRKHCLFKHKHSVIPCKVCESGFSRKRYLRDHEHFCSGGRPLSCTFCERVIGGFKALEDHMHAVHMKARKFSPEKETLSGNDDDNDVGRSSSTSSKKEPREKWKVRERNFRKKVSQMSTNLKLLSPYKLRDLEGTTQRKPYCTNCSSTECNVEKVKCLSCFKIVQNDPNHMDVAHPCSPRDNPWLYTCRFLLKTALAKKDWMVCRKEVDKNNEEKEADSIVFIYRCLNCDGTSTSRKELLKHMDYEHKIVPLLCVVCESGFIDRKYLRAHEHYCSGQKVMKCPICDKEIGDRKALRDHLTKVHKVLSGGAKKKRDEGELSSVAKKPRLSLSKESHEGMEDSNQVSHEDNGEKQIDSDNTGHIVLSYYEVIPSDRTIPHVKMCNTCGDKCTANVVRCNYCGDIITVENSSNHMADVHPYTPTSSLWPVSCRFVKHQASTPHIMAKPTGEKTGSDGKEIIISDPLYTSVYQCQLCKVIGSNSSEIEKHMLTEHSLKLTFCKQCGCGLKKSVSTEHAYFCTGGELLKCKECDKIVGGAHNAVNHRAKIHPINPKPKQKHAYYYNPRTLNKSSVAFAIVGKYGYNILSADCLCGGDVCTNDMVKCGLCGDIVPKDDIHMKIKHPYSPCPTWVVYCKYSIAQCTKHTRDIVGQKYPTATEEEIVSSPLIPCSLPYNYQCLGCNVVYSDLITLREHVKSHHVESGRRLFSCKHCEALLTNMSTDDFSNHVHLCGEGTLFSCEYCDVVCTTYKYLYYHIAGAHRMEKLAKQAESGVIKQESMEIPEGTEVFCSECEYKTLNVSKMRSHVKEEHNFTTTRLNQVCKFCYQFFKTRSSRERHEQHKHLDGQRVLCDICGKDFEIPVQLKFHMYYFHKGGREVATKRKRVYKARHQHPSVCHHCGNVYRSSIACKAHVKNIHERKPSFQCKYCPRFFSTRAAHKLHEDRHIGNKTHRCPYCTFKGYTGYNINKHVERSHPGVDYPFAPGQRRDQSTNIMNFVKEEEDIHTFAKLVDVAELEKESEGEKIITSYIDKASESETLRSAPIVFDISNAQAQGGKSESMNKSTSDVTFHQTNETYAVEQSVSATEEIDTQSVVEGQNLVAVMVDENVVTDGCYTFISY